MDKNNRILIIIPIILITLTCLLSCKSDRLEKNEMEIKATITGLRKAKIYLYKKINGELTAIDSLRVEDTENFTFKRKIPHPDMYWVKIKRHDPMPVFCEPGMEISLKADMDSLYAFKINGNKTQRELTRFLSYIKTKDISYQKAYRHYATAIKNKDEYGADQWLKKMNRYENSKTLIALNYASKNGKTQLSPYIALNYLPDLQPKWYDSIYLNLNDSIKRTYFGRQLKRYIEGLKLTTIGHFVSPMQVKDVKGKNYTLPIKGKQTVIYFWRTSDLKSRSGALLINSLDSIRNVAIFTVNIESDLRRVRELPEFDSYKKPIIVSDKGLKAAIVRRFALRDVPGSVIIDKNGKISALGLSASSILAYFKKSSK